MAKIYGLFGSMTGKVADVVMAVRNGEQIARKYQPVVSNPSTPAQMATRAKLKMLSQLGAVMGSVIAMPKQGSVSARNIFTKVNFPKATFSDNTANIALDQVDLTNGILALPGITATPAESSVAVSLGGAAPDLDRVVYCLFRKINDELFYVTSTIVETPGAGSNFAGSLETPFVATSATLVAYAYGVRDNNDRARGVFGNLTTPSASSVAQLITSRVLTLNDISLTETRAALLNPA